jgi:hypothetical protein
MPTRSLHQDRIKSISSTSPCLITHYPTSQRTQGKCETALRPPPGFSGARTGSAALENLSIYIARLILYLCVSERRVMRFEVFSQSIDLSIQPISPPKSFKNYRNELNGR